MPLPADLEKAFAQLEKKIEKIGEIKASLDKLRTLVLGHYQDVNGAVKTLEDAGKKTARELGLTNQKVANLQERMAKLERATGTTPNLSG